MLTKVSAVEYAGWSDHFVRYPPGDYLAQSILAQIWAALASFLSNEPRFPHEVAPWLEADDVKAEREKRASKTRRAANAALIAGIYKSSKSNENNAP